MQMPGLDGTGPGGMGPMTGGARGYCNPAGPTNAGYGGYANPWAYRTMGYGMPGAYGYPYGGWGTPSYGMGMAWGRGRAPMGYGRGMAWGRGGGFGRGFGMGRGGFGRW